MSYVRWSADSDAYVYWSVAEPPQWGEAFEVIAPKPERLVCCACFECDTFTEMIEHLRAEHHGANIPLAIERLENERAEQGNDSISAIAARDHGRRAINHG